MGKYNFELDLYDDNTISWIANRIEVNSRVLEFGPAYGRLTRYLKEEKNCTVDIVEIDEESGKEAARYAKDALLGSEKGNIEKYYWLTDNKEYDFIIFADVLEHLINPDIVLKRCKNVIAKKGKILVSVPNIAHNSVIIDLINDKFNYNQTGILDNTHLKFFTRRSFAEMAVTAGWAVVEEKAKYIRVGECEIKNSYTDVPVNIRKELMHRAEGDVYQYMFTLAETQEYLLGEEYRCVSLDSTSYYHTELQYAYNDTDTLDYKKSICRNFDPYNKKIKMRFALPDTVNKVLIKPINCNCVVNNVRINAYQGENQRMISELKTNAVRYGDFFYSLNEFMEIETEITEGADIIEFEADILDYNIESQALLETTQSLVRELKHIEEICETYEKELNRREKEYNDKLKEKDKLIQEIKEERSIKGLIKRML